MSMVVKAFLEKAGDPKGEIRRFSVPSDVTSSFAYINGKVSEVFPCLARQNFSLFWKDQEGDLVSFSSDTELLEALGFVSDGVFKIFVKEKCSGPQLMHPGVFCDGCNGPVHGIRYKCFECPDYDLCSECEAKGLHPEHEMCKIPTPRPSGFGPMQPPYMRRWMKRYMNRLHCNNGCPWANGCPRNEQAKTQTDTDSAEEEPEQEKPEQEKTEQEKEDEIAPEEECFMNAILHPFGINVDIDVEHPGRRHGCHKPGPYFKGHGCGRGRGPWHQGRGGGGFGRGGCGGGFGRGGGGFHGCGFGFGRGGGGFHGCGGGFKGRAAGCPWQRFQQGNATGENEQTMESDQAQAAASDAETEKERSSTASGPMNVVEPRPETDGEPITAKQGNGSEDEWTILNDAFRRNAVIQPRGSPLPPASVPLHPDAKINDALKKMLAMGFQNDGGWLTSLLEAKNGDISQVLDSINPQRSLNSGFMA